MFHFTDIIVVTAIHHARLIIALSPFRFSSLLLFHAMHGVPSSSFSHALLLPVDVTIDFFLPNTTARSLLDFIDFPLLNARHAFFIFISSASFESSFATYWFSCLLQILAHLSTCYALMSERHYFFFIRLMFAHVSSFHTLSRLRRHALDATSVFSPLITLINIRHDTVYEPRFFFFCHDLYVTKTPSSLPSNV